MKEGDEPIDIAFPRREAPTEQSHGGAKDFDMQSDATLEVTEDLARRDFTVNALALEISQTPEGKQVFHLKDHVGGITDLQNKELNAVGDPHQRIAEYNSRALRALRFAVQKHLALSPTLQEVIKRLNAKNETQPPLLAKVKPDGRFVIPRETVAKEVLKAFGHDPTKTLELSEELGFLADLFPEFFSFEPLSKRELPSKLRTRTELTNESHPLDDPTFNTALRTRVFEHAKRALTHHKELFDEVATVDDYLFILTYELGKSHHFAYTDAKGSERFTPEYLLLSQSYMKQMVDRLALDSMSTNHHLKVHPDRIEHMMGRYYDAISLLSVDLDYRQQDPHLPLSAQLIERILRTFPELTNDPLWRILQSNVISASDSDLGVDQLARLEQQLCEVETIQANAPDRDEQIISGGIFAKHFFFERSREIAVAVTSSDKLRLELISTNTFESDLQLRRRFFAKTMGPQSPTRTHWNNRLVAEKDGALLASQYKDETMAKRSVLRALERAACFSYLGESLDEAAINEPAIAAELGLREALVPFVESFANILAQDPQRALLWLENGFKKDMRNGLKSREVAAVLFPEIKPLMGCEQDDTYHSEGDVWTHTKLLYETAQKQGFEQTPELALAILFHDTGKPKTQTRELDRIHFFGHEKVSTTILREFFDRQGIDLDTSSIDTEKVLYAIEHHGDFYGNTPLSLLEARRFMPEGTKSLLYQLVVCDALASIPADPSRSSAEFVSNLTDLVQKIELEHIVPGAFDAFVESDEMTALVGTQSLSAKHELLYGLWIEALQQISDKKVDIEEISQRVKVSFIQANREWTRSYVGRALLMGKQCIARGITGKKIGELQNSLTDMLMDGQEVTEETISMLLLEKTRTQLESLA